MSSSKETVNGEQKPDGPMVIQPKSPTTSLKRKLVDVSLNEVKQVKILEEKTESHSQFCGSCNRKLKLISTFTCRCKKSFCAKHRFFDQHGCTFDYKGEAKSKLLESNPKMAPRKISE